jgi:hypothetical protein
LDIPLIRKNVVEGELMSYKALIDSQLALAFRQLKDLAEDAIFKRAIVGDFDFSTLESNVTNAADAFTKVVVVDKRVSKGTEKWTLLFRVTDDIKDMNDFSRIEISGISLDIGPVLAQKNYIILVEGTVVS